MDVTAEARKLFLKNRRITNGYQYTVPSPGKYPYQWLWDSCFHAIVLASLEPDAAKSELRSLLSKQFPSGMLPHIIFWEKKFPHLYDWGWGTKGTSSITQPPMLAYAVWDIFKKTGDRAFLEEVYPRTLAFYRYFAAERDPAGHGVAGIINPDESGEDNSPRFDMPLGVSADVPFWRHLYRKHKLVLKNAACNFEVGLCMSRNFFVLDVPFNAILVKNLEALGHIASLLSHEEGEHFAVSEGERIEAAMRAVMLEDGVFWSVEGNSLQKLKVATWAHFAPLFADIYTKDEAKAVVEKYFHDPATFKSPFGIRTVSKQEPSYRVDGFWRGPIWFAPHWFMYKGLHAYGFTEEAAYIRDATFALLEKNGFREYFDPETGKAYGASGFTWGALALDML